MKYTVFAIAMLITSVCSAQQIKGTVSDQKGGKLVGATVVWMGTNEGTTTDDNGSFSLTKAEDQHMLVVSFVGFQTDTFHVEKEVIDIVLYQNGLLKEAVVKKKRDGVIISDLSTAKREVITGTELKRAACCDLAGAFSTQASVKAQLTNVLTNAKELRISGLSGVYNQVLIEGFPLIQGLTYTYGISSIPGTLVKNIYVSKGANSVLQGYESVSGQVNVITVDPACGEKVLVNGYVNSFGTQQLNFNLNRVKGEWSNIISGGVTRPAQKFDQDKDGFMDLPQVEHYHLWTRWKYKEEDKFGWSTRIGLRALYETRIGGQVDFDPDKHLGSREYYGQHVDIKQSDFFAKTAYRFSEDARIVLFNSITAQDQNSWYGVRKYDADQVYSYNNVQIEKDYKTVHKLKAGASYRHFNLNEDLSSDSLDGFSDKTRKQERVPGVFAENEANFLTNRLTILTGARLDHHNEHSWKFTPRMLVRLKADQMTTIRFNLGKGWRTANVYSENIRMLISSRQVVMEDLEAEEAINTGLSITRKFDKKKIRGYVTVDFAFTDFQNQVFPLYVTENGIPQVQVINFKGQSRSESMQIEASAQFLDQFEAKAAYNYLDVYHQRNGQKVVLPFNNKHRFLATFSWNPEHDKFHWDANVHWFGPQSMPNTSANPEAFQTARFSESFSTLASQFTYNFTKWELYGGCENILDFRQLRPILSYEDPFGPYFDTSSVWGPTRGREFYLGFRYYPAR